MKAAPSIRPAGAGAPAPAARPERPARQRRPRPQVEALAAEPAVDPRFSARRIAVRRDAGRRRLRRLTWVGILLALVAGAAALTRTPLLDLDTVEVQGVGATLTADQVRAVVAEAGLTSGTPLLGLDTGPAVAALEALPAVQDATVTRHWPGTITVEVVERVPVAAIAVAGGLALVGADGIVVAVGPDPAGLVVVDGPPALEPGDRVEATALLAVAAALPEALRPLVTGIGQDAGGGVELRLAPSGIVRLGGADQLAEKLTSTETMLTQIDTSCVAVIDVQVPSAPTVNRQAGC